MEKKHALSFGWHGQTSEPHRSTMVSAQHRRLLPPHDTRHLKTMLRTTNTTSFCDAVCHGVTATAALELVTMNPECSWHQQTIAQLNTTVLRVGGLRLEYAVPTVAHRPCQPRRASHTFTVLLRLVKPAQLLWIDGTAQASPQQRPAATKARYTKTGHWTPYVQQPRRREGGALNGTHFFGPRSGLEAICLLHE